MCKLHLYLFYLFWLWGLFVAARGLCLAVVGGLIWPMACGILVSWLGIEPPSHTLKGRFLATGSPGKSLMSHFPEGPCAVLSRSVVSDSVTPWTAVCQAPLSMGFSRQEYWNELPFPSPGDLLDPGMEPRPPHIAGRFFAIWATRGAPKGH